MISPHFPPDTSAATHRARLLAPHLPQYGWEPTVLTVDERDYAGRLDEGLRQLTPEAIRVVRQRAWAPEWARRCGIGDLGLRSWNGLRSGAERLLREERFDALFITIFPAYTALLGAWLTRRWRLPFVLDYQDPWVNEWGRSVGGGRHGRPDLKSRISRSLALLLEPVAAGAASAYSAVSMGTLDGLCQRHPEFRGRPRLELPIGGEPADFEHLRAHPRANPWFNPQDGCFHLCYVGTLLPLGLETLRAVLKGAARLRQSSPQDFARLRLHFFGTGNQTFATAPRVLPLAAAFGVSAQVTEVTERIDYLDALTVQTQASAILMMGSSERHYTASKLYPGLLSARPVLAVYHEASTVVSLLRGGVQPPAAWLVTYTDQERAESKVEGIAAVLPQLMRSRYDASAVDWSLLREFSAEHLAGRLAGLLDGVANRPGAREEW